MPDPHTILDLLILLVGAFCSVVVIDALMLWMIWAANRQYLNRKELER